jgi:hypothetical protein
MKWNTGNPALRKASCGLLATFYYKWIEWHQTKDNFCCCVPGRREGSIPPPNKWLVRYMKDLTWLMCEYRLCLRAIWNTFLAAEGDWDDRDYFYNAAVQLFKAIVLFSFEEQDRKSEILPAYRGDQKPFMLIRVKTINSEGTR